MIIAFACSHARRPLASELQTIATTTSALGSYNDICIDWRIDDYDIANNVLFDQVVTANGNSNNSTAILFNKYFTAWCIQYYRQTDYYDFMCICIHIGTFFSLSFGHLLCQST